MVPMTAIGRQGASVVATCIEGGPPWQHPRKLDIRVGPCRLLIRSAGRLTLIECPAEVAWDAEFRQLPDTRGLPKLGRAQVFGEFQKPASKAGGDGELNSCRRLQRLDREGHELVADVRLFTILSR